MMKYLNSFPEALRWTVAAVLSQWFFLCLGISIFLAYEFPYVARSGGIIRSEYSIEYGAVALIFLLSGLSMSTQELWRMMKNWRAHLVTQSISFLITPTIIFGFAEIMRVSRNPNLDSYIIVGLIITGCTPTTVSSNVVMTRQSNGNDSLSLIEVSIGNILGAFITPALVQMYLSAGTGFAYGNPVFGTSMNALYARVMKQLGLAVFLPIVVGQVVQNVFPKAVNYMFTTLKLGKVGSFCLILLIWAIFSTAFHQNAFGIVPTESIIMVVFFNVGVFLLFCFVCFIMVRSPSSKFASRKLEAYKSLEDPEQPRPFKHFIYKFLASFYFSRQDTVAVILCGASKTVVLGIPLITAQYQSRPDLIGRVSIPLVLYQGEQLLVAQFLIPIFRRWIAAGEKKKVTNPDLETQVIEPKDPESDENTITTPPMDLASK